MPNPIDEEHDLYAAIGRTLDQWAHLEEALCLIFERALGLDHSDAAAAAFYSQVNYRAKLDMTNAALLTCTTEEEQKIWKSLYKSAQKAASKRNGLAHNQVVFQAQKTDASPMSSLVPILKPIARNPANRHAFVFGTKDLGIGEIKSIALYIARVTNDLDTFLNTATSLKLP